MENKKIRDLASLLEDLKLDSHSPMSTQKAFVRHMVRAAEQTSARDSLQIAKLPVEHLQLEFDRELLGVMPNPWPRGKTKPVR